MFYVILKNVHVESERIVLGKCANKKNAEELKKSWRRLLGGDKRWILNRRPGLDTLDHLGLTIETELVEIVAADTITVIGRAD